MPVTDDRALPAVRQVRQVRHLRQIRPGGTAAVPRTVAPPWAVTVTLVDERVLDTVATWS